VSTYSFLSALPALLALSGFVLYQIVGANRSGDAVTQRILEKLRRGAPQQTIDRRLSAKQVEQLLASHQELARVVGEQDFQLLKQALTQQFWISVLVYSITVAFCVWSAFLFVRQDQVGRELKLSRVVLTDREPAANGALVDVDPLTVTWQPQGEPDDVKVSLESMDNGARTDAVIANSAEGAIQFPPGSFHSILSNRARGSVNRLRAVVQTRTQIFQSDPQPVSVGIVVLTVADSSGLEVAATIDNIRIPNYDFEARVIVPSSEPYASPLDIGPEIAYRFRPVHIPSSGNYDWKRIKAVYFGPDDTRLVRCQFLVASSLKDKRSLTKAPGPDAGVGNNLSQADARWTIDQWLDHGKLAEASLMLFDLHSSPVRSDECEHVYAYALKNDKLATASDVAEKCWTGIERQQKMAEISHQGLKSARGGVPR
jgi:hypothetical protein